MGMFDRFFFEDGVLPDNRVPENYEFQTKDLGRDLNSFRVAKDGTIRIFGMECEELFEIVNGEVLIYSHEFLYDNEDDILKLKYLGAKYQEYHLVIVNNRVVSAEKTTERGYEE